MPKILTNGVQLHYEEAGSGKFLNDLARNFFIWNDFAVDQIRPQHKGIKWHRHRSEPVYHYDDPRCKKALGEIRRRNMPVVLEEEFEIPVRFVSDLAFGVKMIIPHLGLLNGGWDEI